MRRSLALLGIAASALLAACSDDRLGNSSIDSGTTDTWTSSTSSTSPTTSSTTSTSGATSTTATDAFGANVAPGGGVTFRVWAPHATKASVLGDFAEGAFAMEPEGDGVFAVTVPSAHAGTTYQFELTTPEGALTRLDPYARQLTSDKTKSVVVDPSTYVWKTGPFQSASRETAIVYEMHIGSFHVDAGAPQGTFLSAVKGFDELQDLGVNIVEVMPVQQPGSKANGWGYSPQLYFAPRVSYGTADELRTMVDEAHARGMGVWMDTVINHTDGWNQAPLHCFDGDCADGSAGLYYFPIGTYEKTPWGPRPDYTKPRVAEMLVGSAAWWLDEMRGDGFRWDSVSNIRAIDGQGETPGGHAILDAVNELTHDRGKLGVAEDLKGYSPLTKPSADGGFGFDAQWDGFGYQVMEQLSFGSDDQRSLDVIEGALTGSYNGDPFARVLFIEDHDTVGNNGLRLPNRIDAADPTSYWARRRSMLGGVLLLTAPGIPMLFMGQEALATGTFPNPPPPVDALANPTLEGEQMRLLYKDLIRLRRNLDGKSAGLSEPGIEVFHKNAPGKVIAYRRHGASGEDVLVIVNLKNKLYTQYDIGVEGSGTWRIRLDTDRKVYGDDYGDGVLGDITTLPIQKDGKPNTLRVRLGPYSAVVITR